MPKLEDLEATRNRLLEAEAERQSFAERGKKPPKSLRIAGRRFRTADHLLKEREQIAAFRTISASRTLSVREQIRQIADQAVVALSGLQAPIDWQLYAENRLKQKWAEMRLVASKPRIVMREVAYFAGTLFLRDNGWSQQVVGSDEQDRPMPRYAVIVNSLEASLVKPEGTGFRVRN